MALLGLLQLGLVFGCLRYAEAVSFHTEGNRIVDATGRERLFHGVNVIGKSAPYHPVVTHFDANLSFVAEDAALLNRLGLNVIRLGAQWPGVEPQRGQYNQTYIDILLNITRTCAQYNISVFLDAHQDCFSERFCGEGVPLWVAQPNSSFPEPLELKRWPADFRGVPDPELCSRHGWGLYQFTLAAAEGYEALYTNEQGFADQFASFWGKLAAAFKHEPNVLGFELINEPFAGNFYKNPLLMYPGHADKVNLQPFYDRIAPVLRKNDPNRIIMFEPCTWTDEFGKKIFDTGFEHVPGGTEHAKLSIYAYHFYENVNLGDPKKYFEERQEDLGRLGSAGFVTETSTSAAGLDYIDAAVQSWSIWEYKSFLPRPDQTPLVPVCTGCGSALWGGGKYNAENARTLARTYPQAVQGRITQFRFNDTTSAFELEYEANTAIPHPTEIYLNSATRYTKGYHVNIDSTLAVTTHKPTPNMLAVVAKSKSGNGTETATVKITITAN